MFSCYVACRKVLLSVMYVCQFVFPDRGAPWPLPIVWQPVQHLSPTPGPVQPCSLGTHHHIYVAHTSIDKLAVGLQLTGFLGRSQKWSEIIFFWVKYSCKNDSIENFSILNQNLAYFGNLKLEWLRFRTAKFCNIFSQKFVYF